MIIGAYGYSSCFPPTPQELLAESHLLNKERPWNEGSHGARVALGDSSSISGEHNKCSSKKYSKSGPRHTTFSQNECNIQGCSEAESPRVTNVTAVCSWWIFPWYVMSKASELLKSLSTSTVYANFHKFYLYTLLINYTCEHTGAPTFQVQSCVVNTHSLTMFAGWTQRIFHIIAPCRIVPVKTSKKWSSRPTVGWWGTTC